MILFIFFGTCDIKLFPLQNVNVFDILLQGTPVNIIVGSHVWVEDPDEAWIDGQVSKINGKDAQIETSNGKKVWGLPII